MRSSISTRRATAAVVAALFAVSFVPQAGGAGQQATVAKLRGGLHWMLAAGFQPDQRLDYLAEGYRPGDFVVYAVVDKASARGRDIARAGGRLRWTFRSIEAVSFIASKRVVLDLAGRAWVKALYPVRSGDGYDTEATITGTIARGNPPKRHDITVPAGSHAITIDLAVAPPNTPHLDWNPTDFLEARLVDPNGLAVKVRPSSLGQISFRYSEGDALAAGTWALEMWHRSANQPLVVPTTFVYAGRAVVVTAGGANPPVETPTASCGGTPQTSVWRNHANLKRRSVTDIGAPTLWDAGLRGRGVRLAILDSGVDKTHADLDDDDFERWGSSGCGPKVIEDALFLGGQVVNGQGAMDVGGHGTHVAAEAAGTAEGGAEGTKGAYPGVAPEASLLSGRIAIDITALTDDMLAAAEWAIIDQQSDVVNLSYGIDPRYGVLNDANDPQSAGFEALATNPAWGWPVITTSAGNSGDTFNTVGIPAAAPHVNSVAAAVKDWDLVLRSGEQTEANTAAIGAKDALGRFRPSIAGFSSRGPSADFNFAPDFAAPGRRIMAALTNQNPDGTTNGYASFSGTSMAAPHAAGGAALLVEGYRNKFGTGGAFKGRPPGWLIAAALSNTAGTPATRPAFAGGPLTKVSYAPVVDGLLQMFAENNTRENDIKPLPAVGPLVEGAGRINLPAALEALTSGVVVHSTGNVDNPAPHEFQPQFAAGTAAPGAKVVRTLAIHPSGTGPYTVSFRAVAGAPSINAGTIAPSWWTLPGAVAVTGGAPASTDVAMRVPAGTAPGVYTGYLLAAVTGPGVATTLRIPAMVVVEIADYSVEASVTGAADGATLIYGAQQLYTGILGFVGGTAGLPIPDGVVQDMPLYAVHVPEGASSLVLSIDGRGDMAGAAGEWDLFLYDATGVAVADTWATSAQTLTVPNPAPGRYRVAVALAQPSATASAYADPHGVPFRLSYDLVGAANPRPSQVAGNQTPPRPRPRPGTLPATGVPAAPAVFGLLLILGAVLVRRAMAERGEI